MQLSKLATRLTELQKQNEALKLENVSLSAKLTSGQMRSKLYLENDANDISEDLNSKMYPNARPMSSEQMFEPEYSHQKLDGKNTIARGIVEDWARKNQELRFQLQNIQEELRNEVSFAVSTNNSLCTSDPLPIPFENNPKEQLENEHQALVDILSRVKLDFEKAAMNSPSTRID